MSGLGPSIIGHMLQRRHNLRAEAKSLADAEKRLEAINAELSEIASELTTRGHVDPPDPDHIKPRLVDKPAPTE